ncbi:hypothetical protein GCM10022205_30440 [Spinactinospora alkalitolerans]
MPGEFGIVLTEAVLDLGENPPLVLSQSHCTLLGLWGSVSAGACLQVCPLYPDFYPCSREEFILFHVLFADSAAPPPRPPFTG